MSTLELEVYRNELAREILSMDNLEVLKSVRRAYARAVSKVKSCVQTEKLETYTMEELNARIDEAEAEVGGTPNGMFFSQLEAKMPWLCK